MCAVLAAVGGDAMGRPAQRWRQCGSCRAVRKLCMACGAGRLGGEGCHAVWRGVLEEPAVGNRSEAMGCGGVRCGAEGQEGRWDWFRWRLWDDDALAGGNAQSRRELSVAVC